MVRGTFANIRLKNKITPEKEGGLQNCIRKTKLVTIYDAAR